MKKIETWLASTQILSDALFMSIRLHVKRATKLSGTCSLPGDKSISHRALMIGSLAKGKSRISNFLNGSDCLATAEVMRNLGIKISKENPTTFIVEGHGLHGLSEPKSRLDCKNSGTTIRLLAGLLAAQPFQSVLDGSEQIQRRPMGRVIRPLQKMGARIRACEQDELAPIRIFPCKSKLKGCNHTLSVASAQVKSALILAGLYAQGNTTVVEPGPSRDHSERLLSAIGAKIITSPRQITVFPQESLLSPFEMCVPSDPSSAAFVIAAALMVSNSQVELKRVSTNFTRTGFIDAVKQMGADVTLTNNHSYLHEDVANISVKNSGLKGATFGGELIVRMIDELPILAVLATQADGITTIKDAKELKVKETNRIDTTVSELRKMGAKIEALEDGFVIEGKTSLKGALVSSHGDHRLAMALAVAGLCAQGETIIEGAEVTVDSFPGFSQTLNALGAHLVEERT